MGMLGLLPGNARLSGSATIRGTELIGAPEPALRRIRGSEIGLIFQEPMTALNPVLTVGYQVAEVLLSHQDISPAKARERVVELFTLVDLPDPAGRYDLYPHQLSGGQRQRVMIAMAIACDPVLLIADEPTTALDVTVQAEILDLLRDLHHRLDSAILLITHDMGVVADLADDVVVMRHGDIVESGPVREIFARPQVDYTRDLLASVPHLGAEIAAATVTRADPGTTATVPADRRLSGPRCSRAQPGPGVPRPRPGARVPGGRRRLLHRSSRRGAWAWWASPVRARPPSAARLPACCRSPAAACRSAGSNWSG